MMQKIVALKKVFHHRPLVEPGQKKATSPEFSPPSASTSKSTNTVGNRRQPEWSSDRYAQPVSSTINENTFAKEHFISESDNSTSTTSSGESGYAYSDSRPDFNPRGICSRVERHSSISRSSSESIICVPVPPPPPLPEPFKAPTESTGAATRKVAPQSTVTKETPSLSPKQADDDKQTSPTGANYQKIEKIFSSKPTFDDFILGRIIGTGSFGKVYMAKVKAKGKEIFSSPIAIKRLDKLMITKMKQIDHVLSEKAILSRINHPFLVRMHTTFQDRRFLYIVMEFIEGGEFFTYLRRSKKLSDDVARFYAAHITLIFEYLHSHSIVYRDLKPENLLISREGYLKLVDFGFAKVVENRTYTLCGTPEYIAPEVLLNKGHGKLVDWWTLGILIYEMIVGYPPFFDDEALGIYQKILAGKIVFPRFFNRNTKSLVKKLLTHDLTKRYGHLERGVSDVRMHRWFDLFDFDALLTQRLEPPYKPPLKGREDSSNFGVYKDKEEKKFSTIPLLDGLEDPFTDW